VEKPSTPPCRLPPHSAPLQNSRVSGQTLFISFSDMAYREGSIYHAIGTQQIFIIALTLLLTGILLMGLLRREKHGIANIGFESFLILVAYVVAIGILVFHG
jgi:cation:H+ antiporter